MKKYKNIPKGEDTPVIINLFYNTKFDTLDKPKLYIYIYYEKKNIIKKL